MRRLLRTSAAVLGILAAACRGRSGRAATAPPAEGG
jgi:hypothetical protein